MLLNLCFHIAMTSAVFAGGITLTNYLVICQTVSMTTTRLDLTVFMIMMTWYKTASLTQCHKT